MKIGFGKQISGWAVLLLNVLFITLLIYLFSIYNSVYENSIREQNLSNISNLNQSAGELAIKIFENQQHSLKNQEQYISRRGFTHEQLLDFLYDANADESRIFELIGGDHTGYCIKKDADGSFIPVSYTHWDYNKLHEIFGSAGEDNVGSIRFSSEFTDDYSAVKSFAFCTTVPAVEADGTVSYYTLMMLSQSGAFLDTIEVSGGYDKMTSVLFDTSGYYIIGNPAFKADNFFQYLYTANDLSLDEKNAVSGEVLSSESGTLFYHNSAGEDCAYVYRCMADGAWYIVSSVPLASFREIKADLRFTYAAICGMVIIFLLDMLWLASLNRKLTVSMEKERSANNAKTEFLSRMSHDIRTPLNAVIGFSEISMKDTSLPESEKDTMEKINSSGRYLLGLVNDILDMSKIESSKIELHETPVNVTAFLSEIAEVFTAQAQHKGITLTTDFSGLQEQWLYLDKLRTRQIYNNLLNNAIKFSSGGTEIVWQITQADTSADRVKLRSVIADEGCGMSEEFMEKIFQPFVQERNMHSDVEGGTGLGLSIVKSMVELMGGTIRVESELGKGSRFTLELERRIAKAPDEEEGKTQKLEPISALEGRRVLLCEDHPLNSEIAVRLLKKCNLTAETAENGQVGLSMFEASLPDYYAAILMDIRMPVMNGLDAARAIRALDRPDAKTVPIIAMTANAFYDDVQSCLEAGMNDHVAKPIDPQTLYTALQRHIRFYTRIN